MEFHKSTTNNSGLGIYGRIFQQKEPLFNHKIDLLHLLTGFLPAWIQIFRQIPGKWDNLRCNGSLLLLFGLSLILPLSAIAQNPSFQSDLGGYVKELGGVRFNNDFSQWRYDNILQNRLEFSASRGDRWSAELDLRNRLISGYQVRNRPGYARALDRDPGFVDLSWTPVEGDRHIWHLHIDRANLSYYSEPVEISVGRQRLNWSRTFVWSPNDLFNNFAWLDFDYEERPGTDAVTARYNWGYSSGIELAWNPADAFEQSVLAAKLQENIGRYGVQFIGGYYREMMTLGGGFTGYLGDAGLRGELTYFQPLDEGAARKASVSATMGFDYMFPYSIYLRGELLYNGGWRQGGNPLARLTRPPRANNLFIAETGAFLEASYPVHPLVDLAIGGMTSFDRSILILMPRVTVSITNNVEGMVISQLFRGYVLQNAVATPNFVFARVRWSF